MKKFYNLSSRGLTAGSNILNLSAWIPRSSRGMTGFILFIISGCTILRPTGNNTLSCRYRTPDGHLLEKTGLTATGKEKFLPVRRSGNKYLWSCSSAENCPLFLNNDQSYLPSTLWFVVNDSQNESVRTSFVNDMIKSCQVYTPHDDAEFIEFGIKSRTDAQPTFFHKPFFERVHTNNFTPFGRIVAFGDSLTDNGNIFATNTNIAQWPYFIGRFSNGPIWIEDIANSLTEQQKIPIDLYDFAEGGSGTGFKAFNPFSLDKQVDLYLSTMDNTCPHGVKGCSQNKWDPAYDKTLFVILTGANDYMYCASLNTKMRKKNCLCDSGEDCADVVINGRTKNGVTIKGIKNKMFDIIEHAEKINNQKAQFFLVPNLPDVSLSPYYTKNLPKGHSQTNFVHEASVKHNSLLTESSLEIMQKYPEVKILNLNLSRLITNAINNPDYPPVIEARVTNTKDRCFFGNPTDSNSKFCRDPASHLFWDYIHPSMTTHCIFAEYAMAEIYSTFFTNLFYTPNYARCHNSYITH